jgi:hypothetical protein
MFGKILKWAARVVVWVISHHDEVELLVKKKGD